MDFFIENISLLGAISPLIFFIVAVTFRLMDNSAVLFLKKEILVNSSNVSRKLLKDQIRNSEDLEFRKNLKKALIFRNLQQSCMMIALFSLPLSIYYFLNF
ncbi:hypothetical protein DHD80_15080 [Gramella sp. AN32]|nr:hypothetical protein [Gramella sp. AN32]